MFANVPLRTLTLLLEVHDLTTALAAQAQFVRASLYIPWQRAGQSFPDHTMVCVCACVLFCLIGYVLSVCEVAASSV